MALPAPLVFSKLRGAVGRAGHAIGGRAGNQAMEDVAKFVVRSARARKGRAPGVYPRGRTDIERQGANVELRAPWAFAAEFGANTRGAGWGGGRGIFRSHWGFPRSKYPKLGALWAQRVTVGTDTGYIVGAAWRAAREKLTNEVADEMLGEYSRELSRAGFPRR